MSSSPIIFVDGSYFCFYRYYSILNWWKNAYKDEPLENPIENPKFVEKYRKTFVDQIKDIPSRLGLSKTASYRIIVGKDCKRPEIWRTALYPGYKANRPHDDTFLGGPFFKMAYDELFAAGGASQVLYHPSLEADDCIALSVKHLLQTTLDTKIYIITSDKDYLQLVCDRVEIYNLAYKKLDAQKSSSGNSECDLFCKIVMGDISDNIKSVIKKCGPKTAMKCYEDREYFEARLKTENAYEAYKLNSVLVDFNNIPTNLAAEFLLTAEL
jgi:5'-3' exonuclease